MFLGVLTSVNLGQLRDGVAFRPIMSELLNQFTAINKKSLI